MEEIAAGRNRLPAVQDERAEKVSKPRFRDNQTELMKTTQKTENGSTSEGAKMYGCDWGERAVTDERAQKKTEEFLRYCTYLSSDASYSHHKEQLFLMCKEAFSKAFIETIFCQGADLDLATIDLIRCLALAGDEKFALAFYKRKFTLAEAKEALWDYAARRKSQMFDSIDKLTEELGKSRDRFDTQMEFLKREYENSKEYADEIIRRERETAEQMLESERTNHAETVKSMQTSYETEKALRESLASHEIEGLQNNLSQAAEKYEAAKKEMKQLRSQLQAEQDQSRKWQEEQDRLKQEIERLKRMIPEGSGKTENFTEKTDLSEMKSAVETENRPGMGKTVDMDNPFETGTSSTVKNAARENKSAESEKKIGVPESSCKKKTGSHKKGILPFLPRERESRKRNDFVVALITNPNYSDEQYEIICSAIKAGLTLKELEQICNPKLPARNMRMLANFFLRPEDGIVTGKGEDTDGSTSKEATAEGSGEGA